MTVQNTWGECVLKFEVFKCSIEDNLMPPTHWKSRTNFTAKKNFSEEQLNTSKMSDTHILTQKHLTFSTLHNSIRDVQSGWCTYSYSFNCLKNNTCFTIMRKPKHIHQKWKEKNKEKRNKTHITADNIIYIITWSCYDYEIKNSNESACC